MGPVFNTSNNTAQALTIAFVAITYAPGIPLLMPCACLSFYLFFTIDKWLISRFYHRPPRISEGVINRVLEFLPYAGIIRLAFACWMLSDPQFYLMLSNTTGNILTV